MAFGEDENIPEDTTGTIAVASRGPFALKNQAGQDVAFQSNASASMTSDDGLNLSVESDVDMSMA